MVRGNKAAMTASPPPSDAPARDDMARLLAIMARLRDPDAGCPWDLAQDFASIVPYTIEEAYEVADAIERADMADLKGELGDLLLQVVFHARMAEEAGDFAFADVVVSIADKMERRHPHIFGEGAATTAGEVKANWEAIKAAERAAAAANADTSALAGVATALPALLRAKKLQGRAARVGFDWTDVAEVRAKVQEELSEFDTATDAEHRMEEAGDLLFALVNLLRHHGIDAEAALRAGNSKFERRFRSMEAAAPDFASLSLADQEALWQQVKRLTA